MVGLEMTGWWGLETVAAAVSVADPIYQVPVHAQQKWEIFGQGRDPYQHRRRHVASHRPEVSSLLQADHLCSCSLGA